MPRTDDYKSGHRPGRGGIEIPCTASAWKTAPAPSTLSRRPKRASSCRISARRGASPGRRSASVRATAPAKFLSRSRSSSSTTCSTPRESLLTGRTIDFRQVPEGGFYWSAFVSRAQVAVTVDLWVRPAALRQGGGSPGGRTPGLGDAAARFMAFPRVPVTHVMWGGDEEFTPEATILFDETIPGYFPTEDIAALAGASVYRLMGAAHQLRQSR